MAQLPRNILVIRMSAMGDVAMTVPVLSSLYQQQNVKLTMLTTQSFSPMFAGMPDLKIVGIDKRGRHKGLIGLMRLFFDLKKYDFDAVADLHDVFRSKVLRLLFSFTSAKVEKINKGRADKKQLAQRGKNQSVPLQPTVERYRDVFKRLGFTFELNFTSVFPTKPVLPQILQQSFGEKNQKWIGIAPFAKHQGKIYPLEKMEQVVHLLDKQGEVKIFLFGNGAEEKRIMTDWKTKYASICLMPTECRLADELKLMAQLDVMVSMDSANMHLASLVGLPVVSIWGATHHYAGFLGWHQSVSDIVEVDLPCRPCSVYGNIPCRSNDYACMNNIKPEAVVEKIKRYL